MEFGVRSRGRDGVAEGDAYTWGSFPPTEYDRDIVWMNGVFVTWPGGVAGDGSGDGDDGCNQGVGNGAEGCDPGDSNHNQPSNDEPNSPTPSPGNTGRGGGKGGKKGGG